MFSLLDPAREEVPDAVLKARRAQIRIAMVTGDHPTTAAAIAKQVNILSKEISIDHGIDSFKFERNNAAEQTTAYLMRDTHTLLESHIVGELATNIDAKGIPSLTTTEKPSNTFQRIWTGIHFYFSDPHQSKDVKRLELIPYGVVVAGVDIHSMDVSE
jgi:magnesium-transporting ATPase (P-type)